MTTTPSLHSYLVEWSVTTQALSPEEAARNAKAALANGECDVNVCTVIDEQGEKTNIDLRALQAHFYLHIKIATEIDLAEQVAELDYSVVATGIVDTAIMEADFEQRIVKVRCSLSTPYSWESVLRLVEDMDYTIASDGTDLDTEIIDVTHD